MFKIDAAPMNKALAAIDRANAADANYNQERERLMMEMA